MDDLMKGALLDAAALLPDLARWIEVRSMLLHGHARLIGDVVSSPPAFVALYRDDDQAVVVGRAAPSSILEVAAIAEEILVVPEDEAWVRAALPAWHVKTAILYRRGASAPLPDLPAGSVRFFAPAEIAALPDLPDELRDELRDAYAVGRPVAVALDGDAPAAFSYAGSITETLWDVSIDTLEPYRRRGHALRAVTFLIAHYATLSKEPVWGAYVDNQASIGLAACLGFTQVDTLSVLIAPGHAV
jgi:hypothetical protein